MEEFPMTTQELQEKIRELLGDNEELKIYQNNRVRDIDRKWLPNYHFASPGGYLNDPCGYCYYKGVWHLFYQFIPEHTGQLGWGHAVSVDKIHWIDLPAAIMPTIEICCGSGGAWVEDDRVIAGYQGDLKDKEGGAIHIVESTDDLLINWKRITDGPVICTKNEDGERNPYNAFDPCLWKEGDTYYLLSAGGGSLPHPIETIDYRKFYLFKSTDLITWAYCHSFLEDDKFSNRGDDGACPYFLPLGDKYILLHFSHMSGGRYIIGTYDTETHKMKAEDGGAFNVHSWISGGVHAPSACSDGHGGVNAIFNLNYGCWNGSENQIMSLPRVFTLSKNNTLLESPDGDYASLRYNYVCEKDIVIPENEEVVLDKVQGNALELNMKIENALQRGGDSLFNANNLLPLVELRVLRSPDASEYTSIRFYRNRSKMNWEIYRNASCWGDGSNSVLEVDVSSSTLSPDIAIHPNESCEVYVHPDEAIELHVFVDKSVVEVFANNQRCVAIRTYPSLGNSTGVSVLSKGVPSKVAYEAWNMKSIYKEN